MNDEWIGKVVSLNCGSLGFYQGVIHSIQLEESTITIKNAFQNGLACKRPHITLRAGDIKDLKILEKSSSNDAEDRSMTEQPLPKQESKGDSVVKIKKKPSRTMVAENLKAMSKRQPHSPHLKDGYSPRDYRRRDEECFGNSTTEEDMGKEFDFEKNLALFDKRLVFDELDQRLSNQPDVVKNNSSNNSNGNKYRNDESVLESIPAQYRQIMTKVKTQEEYVTDSGLIIPSVSYDLRNRIITSAESAGITRERITELMARAASDIAIHTMGGCYRLNPSNTHQLPTAVILCGPSQVGSYGLAIARTLASHGIKTIVYLSGSILHFPEPFQIELNLYKLTGQKLTYNCKDLPNDNSKIDIVINALEDQEMYLQERSQPWHRAACQWANSTLEPRNAIMAIDPPPPPPPPPSSSSSSLLNSKSSISNPIHVPVKLTIVPGFLPLYYSNQPNSVGKLYMVNLGIPQKVFTDCKVQYSSPYGAKSAVQLYHHPSS